MIPACPESYITIIKKGLKIRKRLKCDNQLYTPIRCKLIYCKAINTENCGL